MEDDSDNFSDKAEDIQLLANIKSRLSELESLLPSQSEMDDVFYRFYHFSFKVYLFQAKTVKIVEVLRAINPDQDVLTLKEFFEEILAAGANGKVWQKSHNDDWIGHTRPIVEAYIHAVNFLRAAVRAGKEIEKPTTLLPVYWASLLELYNIR